MATNLRCPSYGDAHRNYVVRISSTTIQCVKCMEVYNATTVDNRFGDRLGNIKQVKIEETLSTMEP